MYIGLNHHNHERFIEDNLAYTYIALLKWTLEFLIIGKYFLKSFLFENNQQIHYDLRCVNVVSFVNRSDRTVHSNECLVFDKKTPGKGAINKPIFQ